MSSMVDIQEKAASNWVSQNPVLAAKGIDEALWAALSNSVFPGARQESILMAVDYCRANQLDILQKPAHIVPMSVKNALTDKYEYRDIIMPGVGLYRIQADRSGSYAGADAPEFGEKITKTFTDKNKKRVEATFPEWCRYTVYKMVSNQRVAFTALEYWEENYATDSSKSSAPNAMWTKRPCGQLAKCTEAQALRRAWPEIGQMPTAEEMEGKSLDIQSIPQVKDMGVIEVATSSGYSEEDFKKNFPAWEKIILNGKKTPVELINKIQTKGLLSDKQKAKINNIGSKAA